jgi:hypothetical protein
VSTARLALRFALQPRVTNAAADARNQRGKHALPPVDQARAFAQTRADSELANRRKQGGTPLSRLQPTALD